MAKKKITKKPSPIREVKLSPTPPGKGKGITGTSKKTPKPEPPKREPEKAEFLEDIRLDDVVMPDLPPKEDVEVEDLGRVTKELLQKESTSKPLAPVKPKSEEDELEDIIKSVEKEIDIPQNINGKPKIDDSDRTSEEDFLDKITKQQPKVIKIKPIPVKVIKKSKLKEEDRIRLDKEEEKRRQISKERELNRLDAIKDENVRRSLVDAEIKQKQAEFQLFLDEKYPEFSKVRELWILLI